MFFCQNKKRSVLAQAIRDDPVNVLSFSTVAGLWHIRFIFPNYGRKEKHFVSKPFRMLIDPLVLLPIHVVALRWQVESFR